MTVSDTLGSAAPDTSARPAADRESPEEIVARLERWVAAAAVDSNRLRPAVPAPGASGGPRPPAKVRDDLLPSDPGWSAILNEDVTPVGLATVACLFTLLAYVALGLRIASVASTVLLGIALIVGRNRDHSALATRVIVGVGLGIAIACLS